MTCTSIDRFWSILSENSMVVALHTTLQQHTYGWSYHVVLGCQVIKVTQKGDKLENWEKKFTPQKIVAIVEDCGIEIRNWHDGLIFKQQFDRRDNNFNYSTLVIHGVKR